MASKIFMGVMPELLENILNNLNNGLDSLYSCALVSRHWCKMSIPILWQDPFSFHISPLFISNYFSSLDENEKFVLKECLRECGINTEFSKTLFDYAKFLKALDLFSLENKVREWIDFVLDNSYCNNSSTNRIINLLFKLFIENGATLHKLDLYFPNEVINPEIFDSLEQNVQCFSQLQSLSLDLTTNSSTKSVTTLLRILAKNTTKISALKLGFYSYYEPQLFNTFIRIIKSQEQLRKFSLVGEDYSTEVHDIISALESQKNSLQEVIIAYCDFIAEFEILKDCKNLETLRIRYCDTKLLNILDYKITALEIADFQIDVPTIVHILEKSDLLLQRLKIESDKEIWEQSLLLNALKSFCPNITYLNIWNIRFSTQLLELIGNLKKLQFLTLYFIYDEIPEEELKIRVMQFAEILPITLQYLDLINVWIKPYVDILLNHCNAPLKKLLIFKLDSKKNSKALIEFCVRNKSLNYVGVLRKLDLDDDIRNELEAYVKLVPRSHIVVNC